MVTFKPIFQLSAAKFFLTLVFGNFGENFDRFIRFLRVSFLINITAIELSLNVMSSVESNFKFATVILSVVQFRSALSTKPINICMCYLYLLVCIYKTFLISKPFLNPFTL